MATEEKQNSSDQEAADSDREVQVELKKEPRSRPLTIEFKEGTQDVFRKVAYTLDTLRNLAVGSETMMAKVHDMENSWRRSTDSLFAYMAMGKVLHVSPDFAPMSLYWWFETDGKVTYNGGLIFHANHDMSIPEEYRDKLGTFSIHT